ncbi:MAG TPA: S9 family peptidase [Chitinophagaceae bacterium]|nr:S9 family peptidase [Chitinophagaceae bacterium]
MKSRLLLVVIFIFPLLIIAQKNWTPEQALKIKNITSVLASPDGSKVLYTVREAVMTDDRSEYINQVWLCNADGSNTIQLTKGEKNSSNLKWSPDGKWIAFTSSRDSKNNLYILPVGGGEAEKVTDVKTSVGNYDWSRDGKMIAFTMQDAAEEREDKNKKAKNDWYFTDEEIKQNRLYVLWPGKKDTAGKYVQKKITKENYNVNGFDWSADGKSIVFSHGKSPEVNDNVYSDISLIDIESGNLKSIANTAAGETNPQFSPDGKQIVYYSTADPVDWPGPRNVRVYSLADARPDDPFGRGKSWPLKATPNESGGIIGWTPDGKNIIYSEPNKTLNSVYLLSVDGKSISEWNKGSKEYLSGATLNSTGTHLTFTLQNPSQLPEAYISTVSNFSPQKVTNLNAEHAGKPLPKTEVVKWKGADGREIEGLLTYPLNYKPGEKVPFILNVHGGPAGVFQQTCVVGNSGTYPIAAFAEMGVAVLRPNPRGSTGYGAEFRMANRADWGGKDFLDLMAGVDHVIKMGVADEKNMGVMGWSYGGFMSSWIVGHTDRFKAASIGAPVVDLAHQNLTDDIEGFLPSYFKANPWDDWSKYDAHSPLRFVQNVKTPVLLQHCEGDQRVPISNSIMYYNALRRRKVQVRMLTMPRQGHGPVEPTMVLKTMQTNVEWFEKHIGDKKGF